MQIIMLLNPKNFEKPLTSFFCISLIEKCALMNKF